MKNIIMSKLRSQTGASITFALLIFLVCTVLCSVILTAATASSGRMSGIAEGDQRYYAVTSAAELFEKVFKKHSVVTVAEKTVTNFTTTYKDGVQGEPVIDGEETTTEHLILDRYAEEIEIDEVNEDNKISTAFPTFNTIQEDAAYKVFKKTKLDARLLNLESTFSDSAGLTYDVLAVAIAEKLDENGDITLTLRNKYKSKDNESKPGEQYILSMSFPADKSLTTKTKTVVLTTTSINESEYKVNSQRIDIKFTTLQWKFGGFNPRD